MNSLAATSGFLALILGTVLLAPEVIGQIPAGSSARRIQTDVENSHPHISQLIAKAEDHFRKGKINLEDNKREQARDEFDRAIDVILESGLDVRASQRLQIFYLELVERIYREEVPTVQVPAVNSTQLVARNSPGPATKTSKPPQIGFLEKKFEPSPLDQLSRLVLTPDERSSRKRTTTDLRAEFIAATKDYKASLKKLLAAYERDLLRANDQLTQARALYSQALIDPNQLDKSVQAVATAKDKINEVKLKLSDADKQIAKTLREVEAEAVLRTKTKVAHASLLGVMPQQFSDGRVPLVIRYLNDNLNDPYSMKLVKWSKVKIAYRYEQPYWYVQLRFRAKNAFGAYLLREAGFYIRKGKVVLTDNF